MVHEVGAVSLDQQPHGLGIGELHLDGDPVLLPDLIEQRVRLLREPADDGHVLGLAVRIGVRFRTG